MKGYFSRIAQQSGIRYSASGAKSIAALENKTDSAAPLSTIERSETIMVPPSKPMVTGDRFSQRETVMSEETPRPAAPEKVRMDEIASPEPVKILKAPAENTPVKNEFSDAGPPAQVPLDFTENAAKAGKRPVSLTNKKDPVPDSPENNSPVVEKTVLVKPGEDREPIGDMLRSASAEDRMKVSTNLKVSKTGEGLPPSVVEKKEFFSKTVEIIGNVDDGEKDPAEIQNIIFREVQEWVAASPANREIPELDESEPPEPIVLQEFVQQREPGVVTIGERPGPEMTERSELSEQSFELSIGSISVVIEEPEKAPEPELPPQRENGQSNGGETKRGYSRLSRHYI